MKKVLIALLIIVVLSGGGVLFYSWYKHQNLTVWSFIPSDAAFVYESKNIVSHWNENADKKIWKNLAKLPFIEKTGRQLEVLDSLFGGNGELEKFFDQGELLLSGHVTSKDALDLLFAFEVKQIEEHDFLNRTLTHYLKSVKLSQSTRQYLGYTITELSNDEVQLSYVFYKNFFIGSFTSFLVEDAIRVIDDSDYFSFRDKNQSLFGLSKIENDQGNFYINSSSLNTLVGVFADPVKANLSTLSKLTDLSFLDVAINDESIVFNGFSLKNSIKGNYLDAFDGVESSEFLMVDLIPTNTVSLFHYSFDDGEKWHKNLKNYWRKNSPELLTNIGELENKYEFPVNDLYDFIGNELGIITLETGNNNKADLIACLHVKNSVEALGFFNQLSDITSTESDTYSEKFMGSKIRQISVEELPKRFFGPLFNGFKSTYYTDVNGYILMANSEAAIKSILDNVRNENTWGKSLRMNEFLSIANRESNLSLFVKTKSALGQIKNKLNEKWLPVVDENIDVLSRVDYCAVQFSNVDGKFYTSIALQHSDKITENTASVSSEFITQVDFPFSLTTKPYGVRNHNDRSLEFVFQDEVYNFYLLSSKYDTLWNKTLEGSIVSKMYQVDYYKNKKLQYLFATEKEIHIIDRTGAYIPGYPIALADQSEISNLSLIDYDGSKNYRIMVSTSAGQYYMFDKSGRNLEGWNPRNMSSEPIAEPFHLRVRNNDVLVFTHKNGTIEVLNRRGKSKKGFPLRLEKNIQSELFVEKGASMATTFMTTLSDDGELMKFNLKGEIKHRKQLFRNNTNDQFQLIQTSDKRSFMILRIENNQTTILDSDGEELFIHEYPLTGFTAQYYNFDSANQIVVLTDKDQEFTYLYDLKGHLLGGKPLNTGNQIAMLYQSASDSYKIFLTYDNHFSVLKLNR